MHFWTLRTVLLILFAIGFAGLGVSGSYKYPLVLFLLLSVLLAPFFQWSRPRFGRLDYALMLSISVLTISVIVNVFVYQERLQSYALIDNFSRLLIMLLVAAVLANISKDRLADYIGGIAALHLCACSVVIFNEGINWTDLSLSYVRPAGTTNPIPFAEMMLVSAGCVAIALARYTLGIGLALLMLFVGLLVAFTQTRGVVIALPVLFLLLGIMVHHNGTQKWMRSGLLLVVFVADLWMFKVIGASKITQTLTAGANPRIEMWAHAIALLDGLPLWGYGLGAFPALFFESGMVIKNEGVTKFGMLHNQYLDVLLMLGPVVFIVFCLVFVLAIFRCMLSQSPMKGMSPMVLWMFGAFAIYSLTQSIFVHQSTTLYFGFAAGLALCLPNKTAAKSEASSTNQ